MNIAIAIESFFDGGAEMFAIRLANALAEQQNIFFIELFPERTIEKRQLALLNKEKITLFQPASNESDTPDAQGITKKLSFLNARKSLRHGGSREQKVSNFIKKNRITVVNSHSWDSDVYFAGLKKRAEFILVSSFHGHYEVLKDKRRDFATLTAAALKKINTVIFTSLQHTKTLDEFAFPQFKRKKVYYGLDLSPLETLTRYMEGETLRLVLVARGIKEKGWLEAIEAVKEIAVKYPGRLELVLVGGGEYLDHLKATYQHPAIKFIGYSQNALEIIADAHIGILPTNYAAESLPNTIIEYLLMGKPVISTDVGAIKEMITADGQTAGVCLPIVNGNVEVKSLSVEIEGYLLNPKLVECHSIIALKAARKFSMKKCTMEYCEVMQRSEIINIKTMVL